MKLEYHRGKNFGDTLNPYVFNYFLPNYFDNDDSVLFIGIGSILGLKKVGNNQKAIVFSSGYADGNVSTYGALPKITDNYNIICVRGPLTAKILNLDSEKAVTDGAILVAAIPREKYEKKWDISFMPHVGSLDFYNWEKICDKLNYKFIDPRKEVELVLKEIEQSKLLITEAMHGAIVADSLRIPWIPVKAYSTINDFKWQDWAQSMQLTYKPILLKSIFLRQKSLEIINNKFGTKTPFIIRKTINNLFQTYQKLILLPSVYKNLKYIKEKETFLSKQKVFNDKLDKMLTLIDKLKSSQ